MIFKYVIENIDPISMNGSLDVEIEGIAYDSRTVKPGWLFVAVMGHKVDGSDYITEAVSNGAVAVISECDLNLGRDVTHVQVLDARKALASTSANIYGHLSREMKVIGVTGTNGKTTTAYMIRELLNDAGFNPGLLGTVAYEIGKRSVPASRTTPEAPDIHALFSLMKQAECDSVVMEVSSHAIALRRVHEINFAISVFTNLTQDHLDYHKSMDSYFHVKATLFAGSQAAEKSAAVINLDDPWGRKLLELRELDARVVPYGFHPSASVCASDDVVDESGTSFHVKTPRGEADVKMKLLGRFNIHNALAAISVGTLMGLKLSQMAETLGKIQSVPGRLELVPNRKGRKVFVDYAHTDDALKNVLVTLREICQGKLIVVFGCGGNRDRGKRLLMGQVAAELADYSIITSDNPRNEEPAVIANEIEKGFLTHKTYEVVLDRHKAIKRGIKRMSRKDILLVAGKGHESYQEIKGTVIPFDDCETVREIFG